VKIPRLFHRIWLGSAIPAESDEWWQTWEQLHPGWDLVTWTEANLPRLTNQRIYDEAETLTAGNVWQFRSDIARYELLAEHGGVYLDTDFEPRRNIEPLLGDVDCFAAWELQDIWIANGFMGATPDHRFIGRLIEQLPSSVRENRTRRPNHATGPRYLTRMHRRHPGEMHVLDQRHVYPYSWDELHRRAEEFPDVYAIHHWANARRRAAQRQT